MHVGVEKHLQYGLHISETFITHKLFLVENMAIYIHIIQKKEEEKSN